MHRQGRLCHQGIVMSYLLARGLAKGGQFQYCYSIMKLRLLVELDPQTKRWSAVFPELPGCASAGDTEEEAIRNAKEALELWFEPSEGSVPAGAKVLEVALMRPAPPR